MALRPGDEFQLPDQQYEPQNQLTGALNALVNRDT